MLSTRIFGLCHLHKKLWQSTVNSCAVRRVGGFQEPDHAALYKKYRARPNEKVIKMTVDYVSKKRDTDGGSKSTVVDVACGSGQGTLLLAHHFHRVIGIDISDAQLEEARKATKAKNVEYRCGTAESLPIDDNSVDLLTCIQAVHWFDFEAFCREADRVLKPKTGCLAIFTSDVKRVQHDDHATADKLNDLFDSLYYEALKPYWTHGINYHDIYLNQLAIPYTHFERHTVTAKGQVSLANLAGYIQSTSAYQNYHRENPNHEDILGEFQKKYLEILQVDTSPQDTVLPTLTPTYLLLGNKPSK